MAALCLTPRPRRKGGCRGPPLAAHFFSSRTEVAPSAAWVGFGLSLEPWSMVLKGIQRRQAALVLLLALRAQVGVTVRLDDVDLAQGLRETRCEPLLGDRGVVVAATERDNLGLELIDLARGRGDLKEGEYTYMNSNSRVRVNSSSLLPGRRSASRGGTAR